MSTKLTVHATINANRKKVWDYYTKPEHITKWNFADPSWHCPSAENDMRIGGKYRARMEAKDGSFGFDFGGIYDDIKTNELITYTIGDGRKVKIVFTSNGNQTKVEETFEAENVNSLELQKNGWQAILDNFKKFVESN